MNILRRIFHSAFDGLLKGHQSVAKLTFFGTGFEQKMSIYSAILRQLLQASKNLIFISFHHYSDR